MKKNQLVVINSGSSSIKFAAYDFDIKLKKSLNGHVENLNVSPVLKIFNAEGSVVKHQQFDRDFSYDQFYKMLLAAFESNQFNYTVSAVGHRVVHGGANYQLPVLVNQQIIDNLKKLIPFAPLHQPYNIQAIESIYQSYPGLPQIACFDTAFHHTHPAVADRFGLPRKLSNEGVRRYGFHGLSYEYIVHKFSELNPNKSDEKIIVAHLGNGASICAIKNGKSIDSTMGFTALDGLVMGTRCGNLDPGVILFLLQNKNMSPREIEKMLYKESGLLGVSEITNNMKMLLENTTQSAHDAIDLYIYRIRRELGGLVAVLGGLDTLIFTGGIGENAWQIRERVCANFEWLNMLLDKKRNINNETIIHDDKSKIKIYMIPTNEEWMIAKHTYDLVSQGDK